MPLPFFIKKSSMAEKNKTNCSSGNCSCKQSSLEQKWICQIVNAIKDTCLIHNPDMLSGVIVNGKPYPALTRCDGKLLYLSGEGLKPIPCDAEFTDINVKDFISVSGCYQTPTGQVYVEGTEALNSSSEVLSGIYEVRESKDTENPIGTDIVYIPDTWVKIECLCNC